MQSLPITTDVVSSNPDQDEIVSNMQQVGGFFSYPPVSSTNKSDRHDITEKLLKVALNTIKQTKAAVCVN